MGSSSNSRKQLDYSKKTSDFIIMLISSKTIKSGLPVIPKVLSVCKHKSQKIRKKTTPSKMLYDTAVKVYYFFLSGFVFFLFLFLMVKDLTLNGTSIFLICLSAVLPLFPKLKKVKLPWIELETSTGAKEIKK